MKKRILSILLFTGGLLAGNCQPLKNGDLIFVVEGKSDFSKAISSATASNDSIRLVHVGIIAGNEDEKFSVIEASPEEGVREIPFEIFKEKNPLTVIKRLKIDFPIDKMVERARAHIGEEYDWWYLPDNDKMYCSELVFETYLDYNGRHIFPSKPMNFRAPDGSMPQFWTDLFKELGQPVPEGIEGTNPNDISNSLFLEEI